MHDLGEQLRQGWGCPSVRYGCARLIRCTQHPLLLPAAFLQRCACSIGGAHRDLQLHCHQAHLFAAPARTGTPRGLRVKPGWPKQTTCFSRGVDPAETRAMSSRSRAAAETVHRVTATLLGRHRRRLSTDLEN